MLWQWQKLLCWIRWYCLMGLENSTSALWALQEIRNMSPVLLPQHVGVQMCSLPLYEKWEWLPKIFMNEEKTVLRLQSGTVILGQTEGSSDSNYERPEIKRLFSICGHLSKGLAASAHGFQHFLRSGGKAKLTAVRDILPRMLHEMIWYLRARCLPKASADTCDW